MSLASSSEAFTLPVMYRSFERSWKVLGAPMVSSFTTERTLTTRLTSSSTRRRSASLPTAPVSSTWRLKLVTLTYMLSLAMSRTRAAARSSMPWSSSCAPELRRSVATMPTPTTAAPPTTSGTQADSPATRAAPRVSARAKRWVEALVRVVMVMRKLPVLRVTGHPRRRTGNAARAGGFRECAPHARAAR
ncbi:hypothetical protein D3C72_1754190 [compost metagenome]